MRENKHKSRFQVLLVKAVDGELGDKEKIEFEQLINQAPEFRIEWEQHKKIKEVTQSMKFKSPPIEIWDGYWGNVYNRLERGIAWILFSLGFAILLTYGAFKVVEGILADSSLVGILKVAIIAVLGGLMLLVVSVVREKVFLYRKDPYKEIQR